MAPEQFGRYRLDALIGRGGMGEVFRAYDTTKNRVVALKRLPQHMATSAEFQARFRRESELAARLREPHVIPIHEYGEIDGRLFIDMRLVEGVDLGELVRSAGRLPPARAVRIVAQVASALDAAHADGLVHRDVKPSNILVTGADRGAGHEDDFVYLVDFGIVRAVDGTGTSMTATGTAVGTIAYMAPERFVSRHSDHRVDVYALTCVLAEALTGRPPFDGEGLPSMMYAHLHAPPPRPSETAPGIPRTLDEVVARGMAKDPAHRYQSAGELAHFARAALTPATAMLSASGQVGPGATRIEPRPGAGRAAGGGSSARWAILIGSGLIVVVLVVLLVRALVGGDELRSGAEAYADAVNIADRSAVERLTCAAELRNVPTTSQLARLSLGIGTVVDNGNGTARVQLLVSTVIGGTSSSTAGVPRPVEVRFVQEAGIWRYCGGLR